MKKILFITVFAALLGGMGCVKDSDFLDVQPTSIVPQDVAFSDPAERRSAYRCWTWSWFLFHSWYCVLFDPHAHALKQSQVNYVPKYEIRIRKPCEKTLGKFGSDGLKFGVWGLRLVFDESFVLWSGSGPNLKLQTSNLLPQTTKN